jgi:hypothetical protein
MRKKLRNPDTGETVSVTNAGAKVLLGRGYLTVGAAAEAPAEEPSLEGMKLADLLDHAVKIGVDLDTLEHRGGPGTSKAEVIAAIEARAAWQS